MALKFNPFTGKLDFSGISSASLSSYVLKAGDTMTGKLNLPASTTTSAGLNLGTGVNPTTPVNGDVWILNQRISWKSTVPTPLISAAINDVNTFTSNQIISTTSVNPALRVTQLGTGEALRVEDETNPDSTAFVVSSTGKVGIGTVPDATVGLKLDSTGVKFDDGSVLTSAPSGIPVKIDVFTANGTWTKPAGAKSVHVVVIGGGGGGGSGRKSASAAVGAASGGGGGGAAYSERILDASILGATESVTVGAGGAGGASQTTNSTNGNNGVSGGNSSFGSFVIASGGTNGGGGTTTTGTAGTGGTRGIFAAGNGSIGTTVSGSSGISSQSAAGGGAAGGGISTSNAGGFGGPGGSALSATFTGGNGAAGNQNGGNGGNATSNPTSSAIPGHGGGGGGGNSAGNGGSGGNGGLYGGGGGGGGAALDGIGNSGAGGNGAGGIAIITTYF